MTDKTDHPFQPGVRVAMRQGYDEESYTYTEQFVEKAHKTGRFTLRGSGDQWRPSRYYNGECKPARYCARPTGEGFSYGRPTVFLWDDLIDDEIRKSIDAAKRRPRFAAIQNRIARMRFNDSVTAEMLDKLEAALPPPAGSTR